MNGNEKICYKKMGISFFLLFLLFMSTVSGQSKSENLILGKWLMPDEMGTLEIFKCNNTFCGKIVKIEQRAENGGQLLDVENPVDSLKIRPVEGLQVMTGFKYAGNNKWINGNFYIPKKGKETSPEIFLTDEDHLNIKIHFFIFSKTVELTRVRNDF